jgi:C4-dicarboxylate-specific signal transduction histidine kinase
VNLSLSVIEGEDRQPVGFLGVANDVTAQRRSAEQLAKAYAQLNSVLACTSDSVITIEQDWTMLYGNRRALEMLPDLVIGKSYWSCFPGVSGTPLEHRMKTAMETRVETSYEIFYEPYQQWFKGRVFPTDTGVSVFFSNCTEEKRMHDQIALEQDLREKRIEALSHMAGGLAHEISNPLAIIHALASDLNARAIGEQSVSSVDVSKASDSIVKTSDRAIRILNGLRGFGREAGKDPMEWASPYNMIEQCRDLQQARFERHNVKLDFAVAPNLPLMLCREVQVGQIVTNLLNNAFDAIDQSNSSERWVTLNAGQVADTIVIDVTDSGPGIQDKFRPHLMDPFFTTKKVGLGMGVGLSLSRAIAHDHGGTLALCSDTPNTCFQLILPIDADVAKQENGMPQD